MFDSENGESEVEESDDNINYNEEDNLIKAAK